jgi:hypothetical protein
MRWPDLRGRMQMRREFLETLAHRAAQNKSVCIFFR